ncbi:MAG: lytic transglycosylase domain-containing protein [Pseudomonadota bacterium]
MLRHAIAVGAALACAVPAWADTPAPFPDFSAKRVKPPKAGATRRIDVQIDPAAPGPAAAPAPTASAAPARIARYDWFWTSISPDLSASGPGRLEAALTALATAPAPVPAPRLQSLQDIARAHGRDILRASIGTQVSPALALAVIAVESGGDSAAISRVGAQGLMQLMPATAAEFGVADAMDPGANITGGTAYLDWLMERFDGDPVLVLAAYNAGPGAVRDAAGVPDFPETRDYVPKVLAAYAVARGLCLTPPQLISDGCVFAALN